ncbi:SHOCT domain-containing protein [Pedobacter sp. UYP30]|uniref:SHOCT domain-containing protein n=1 Tax=Pedobacter sp. UYP30 TaxID=1756400 RepID=UPI003391E065
MNLIWWFIWMILIFWIFATPYNIPGQRKKKDTPLEILQRRFASGEITKDEYLNLKETLAEDSIQINTQ